MNPKVNLAGDCHRIICLNSCTKIIIVLNSCIKLFLLQRLLSLANRLRFVFVLSRIQLLSVGHHQRNKTSWYVATSWDMA